MKEPFIVYLLLGRIKNEDSDLPDQYEIICTSFFKEYLMRMTPNDPELVAMRGYKYIELLIDEAPFIGRTAPLGKSVLGRPIWEGYYETWKRKQRKENEDEKSETTGRVDGEEIKNSKSS